MRPLRVAFHAINGVGLGHLVRVTSIAEALPAIAPGVARFVVTNAHDTSLLTRAGIDFVQLPPRLAEPHADPQRVHRALPAPVEEAVMIAALGAFAPDLVVFDTHAPSGVVRAMIARGARTVLVQRELRPEAMRAFVASGGAFAFDRLVVPHSADEVDAAAFAGLPAVIAGPVVRALEIDAAIDEAPSPLIVAVAGGGGQPVDARRYLRAVIDAHVLARVRIPQLSTIVVLGPYATAPEHVDAIPGLTVIGATPALPSLLARATLAISQAGYNAIAELRALALPAILVPAYRKAEDQRARAQRLVRAGSAVIARPEARAIADRIEALVLAPGALEAMRAAHRATPLIACNRAVAEAVLRPALRTGPLAKVAIIAHDFAPKLGGMETVARALAQGLVARGLDARVYATNRLGVGASGLGDRVRPLFTALSAPLRIDLWTDLLATIDAALADAPDVIHLCHAGIGPWIPLLRAALPCAVTANVHGNDLLAPWVHHGGDDAAYRAAQRAGLAAADAVVCVSRFSRGLAAAHGVPDDVLHTVENGVDVARFAAPAGDLRARFGLEARDEIVLTVSRLAPRKGHRTAIAAIAQLAAQRPRLRYVFTGASEAMQAELAAWAGELGVADRLVPVGFVDDATLPALYQLADAFVLLAEPTTATDVEGFGVALLEAAAAGVPVIATASGGVPEAVGDAGVLIAPGDAAAAAAAIAQLLDDRGAARALGARGQARVARDFGHDRVVERMLAIWRGVLDARRPTGDVAALRAWSANVRIADDAGEADDESPEAAALRALADVDNGAQLARAAQRFQHARRLARAERREQLRRAIARDRVIRLRATGDGARLLPEALEDCAALGHAPRVEVKLRRFLEPDFLAHALPRLDAVELVHGVPHDRAASLYAQLASLPAATLAKIRALRLHLLDEAPRGGAAAVPECHALRRLLAAHGATVVPPPELMRYLSELPAGTPTTAMIEPTNLCNLGCPTCPTGTGKVAPKPQMTLARFAHALDGLPRLANLAMWNYGEPLLNKELPAMIAHAKQRHVNVVKVSSNVHFLDGERGRALLRSGLDVLILSVDGASQDTYATFRKDGDFAKVSRAIAWLCDEKRRLGLRAPRIELQFIVMRHNEHELPQMRELAAAWGVDALRIKTVGADDAANKHLVPASRLLSRYAADGATPNVRHAFCTMAWDHTVINVDGSVTPCCYLRPDMRELPDPDAFVMGNVFEQSFASIWRGEKYRAFRARMLAGRADVPICNKCRGGTHDLVAATEEVAR